MDISKITNVIDQIIDYTAEKLQMPYEKAMNILLKEYTYRMWKDGVWFFVGIVLTITTLIIFVKAQKHWKEDYDEDMRILCFLGIFILGSTGIVTFLIAGFNLLHGYINPEMYIYENILKQIIQ